MKQSDFKKLFPDGIRSGLTIPFVHKGKWAVHELLPLFVSRMGKIDVKIATFNISEDSLRPLFFMLDRKEINSLTLLLDMNVKRHKLDLLLFAANITPDIRLASTHMKVMLVEHADIKIGVVGSANLNNNPRYEAGFISTDAVYYDYFMRAYTDVFLNDSLPFTWN